jgi:hypothetical protein
VKIREPEKIVDLLEQAQALLPQGCVLALVIVMPPDAHGWQAGHTIENGLDEATREFAAEILLNHQEGQVLSRQVH